MASFNGVDIITVPDMTTTVLLLLHKPDCKIYKTRGLTITEKQEAADTQLWQLTCAYNAVVQNPKNSAALTAKTA